MTIEGGRPHRASTLDAFPGLTVRIGRPGQRDRCQDGLPSRAHTRPDGRPDREGAAVQVEPDVGVGDRGDAG